MDEFDTLNQTTEQTDVTNQEEDLFGSGYNYSTTDTTSANSFNPVQQQPDLSWALDDDLITTTTTTTTAQPNIFDDNNLDNLNSTLYEDSVLNTQSNTNLFDSSPTTDFPPTSNELLYNDLSRRSSNNSLSSNIVSNSATSFSTSTITNTNQFNSTEDLSPVQAFHNRRQQELAEMEALEKQKIEELRQQGKKDLERWYEERRLRMEQKRQTMKQEENNTITQALEKSDKETCDWAKVIRYLDFSQGTQLTKQKRDLNRMRTVIISQAKRNKENQKNENGV